MASLPRDLEAPVGSSAVIAGGRGDDVVTFSRNGQSHWQLAGKLNVFRSSSIGAIRLRFMVHRKNSGHSGSFVPLVAVFPGSSRRTYLYLERKSIDGVF